MKFKFEELVSATGSRDYESLEPEKEYEISTDTRTIKQGDFYLPLKGASFDGEKFIAQAIEKGADAYLTTANKHYGVSYIKTDDTKEAYLKIANYARKKYNPKVIGITGSSGKTTTKEMVYSVLKEHFKTHKTYSNHNNEIGFCQTTLSMPEDTEVLIVEMGMRGLGEIELISKFAEPDYTIITNAGSAHIGRLGSLENIAKAKCEITKYQNPKGVFIALNQERIKNQVDFSGKKIYYSTDDVKILEKRPSYSKFVFYNNEYELNVEGDYNIENSLSAIILGTELGMSYEEIKRGLASYHPIEKRWEVEEVKGFKIINDSYNANPESMKASVSTFIELYDNPLVVLGNMGELGDNEESLHREVGRFLAEKNIKNVKYFTVGNLAAKIGEELGKAGFDVKNFNNTDEVSRYILDNVNVGTTIFLKASRSMEFEKIIQNLKAFNHSERSEESKNLKGENL